MAAALTVVTSTRPGIRQGAVYAGAPIFWVPKDLAIVRPSTGRDWTGSRVEDWHDVPDRFRIGDRTERVVVNAKVRPVVIVSHDHELHVGEAVRVVPLYSYHPGAHADRQRPQIEAGAVAHALHVRAARNLHEGYANLREAALVPRTFFEDSNHVGDLDRLSLANLLQHFAEYIAA